MKPVLYPLLTSYKAAFDSVSHKFINNTLASAGVSIKTTRQIFRVIYTNTSGVVRRLNGIHGKIIYSNFFNIGRGVVQGDMISPVLFIPNLDQLVQKYVTHARYRENV